MSRLYLQKGGIDHFIDKGVQLDNKSYTPMSLGGSGGGGGGEGGGGGSGSGVRDGQYELPNAFFAPTNELLSIKEISSTSPLTFSVVRTDTPQLTIPATTIGVSVSQFNSSEAVLDSKEYMLCNGDGLYYEQETPAEGAVKLVVKITNWSREYNIDTGGKTIIKVKGLEQ